MDNQELIKAIQTNDLVKFKRAFNESMSAKIKDRLDEERLRIARTVVLEGEVNEAEDKAVKDEDAEDDKPTKKGDGDDKGKKTDDDED